MSDFKDKLDEALSGGVKMSDNLSSQMFTAVDKLRIKANGVSNQMMMDGHQKEGKLVQKKLDEIIKLVNKAYN